MAASSLTLLILATLTLCAWVHCENLQAWSQQSALGVNHVMKCDAAGEGEPTVTSDDECEWRRLGQSTKIANGGDVVLTTYNGGAECSLELTKVTDGDSGIYFCHVINKTAGTNEARGKVTKGLNIAGPKYTSSIDEYETNIITAFLTGGGVCLLVCACCFVEHNRYRSPEQKQKMEQRRKAMEAKMNGQGRENLGLDTADEKQAPTQVISPSQENTHL